MPADAGIKFGSYVLLRRIARGGMAEVFLAQQRGLEGFDRRVAVKRILPHLADSQDFVRMFLGEAKLAAQLSHPNIVHIYEFGKVDHDYFIAMEYVDGVHAGQLFKAGETHQRLSPTLVARIGADAAAALHHAHELRAANGKPLGLVHRDVSPANIMISYDGVVKLCDFGIAKAAAATDQLTSPGQVKGKYAYMSPEQTIAQPLDGRSDVFSLAICLWELLAGRVIVSRGDAVAAMRLIRDGKLEPLGAVAPQVPPALVKAITWALETKREKRATAAELAQALEAFIKSSPEIATPMQLGSWIRTHFVREHTGEVPAIAPAGVHGTQVAAPGTVASPRTGASRALSAVTPGVGSPNLIGASRLARVLADSRDGDESIDTLEVKKSTDHGISPSTAPSAPTMIAPPPVRGTAALTTPVAGTDAANAAANEPTVLAGIPADQETSDARETVQLDRPSVQPIIPTEFVAPLSGPRPRISEAPAPALPPRPRTLALLTPWRTRPRMPAPDESRRRRIRIASAIAGLVGLMVISFSIALCASRTHPKARGVATGDASLLLALEPADAATIDAAPVPADARALEPGSSGERRPERGPQNEAYLEIVTIPGGGKLRVGDQVRVAPAQIVVDAGSFDVTGELPGFQPEVRHVAIEAGEHLKIELTFNHKIGAAVRVPVALGRLTVRTTPYSEVFENGKKLDQTPFADREMTAGSHTLVFKNPLHPTVTKKISIAAGKSLKLNFALPD
ncbi:MAG TPA: protein kinase [Kofleriaceae bacterium]|nr:protein kinase [Kofleriaceae bacterium]